MKVCVAITADGEVDPGWGWADRVAVADVIGGQIRGWQEFAVSWGALHDQGTEGAIMPGSHGSCGTTRSRRSPPSMWGRGMERMLGSMAIGVVAGVSGDARKAALTVS
jgi:hypothetical protein